MILVLSLILMQPIILMLVHVGFVAVARRAGEVDFASGIFGDTCQS